MRGAKSFESIEWDSERGGVVITKQELLSVKDADSINDVKNSLKEERVQIVRQVKSLKKRAEEINSILLKLAGAGVGKRQLNK